MDKLGKPRLHPEAEPDNWVVGCANRAPHVEGSGWLLGL